jgi:hypothetical protein
MKESNDLTGARSVARLFGFALAAFFFLGLSACDGGNDSPMDDMTDSLNEAAEEIGDETEDLKAEIEDEIDDHS